MIDTPNLKEKMINFLEKKIRERYNYVIHLGDLKNAWILDMNNNEDTTAAVVIACRAEELYVPFDTILDMVEQARIFALQELI
jgi:hypothetical protein